MSRLVVKQPKPFWVELVAVPFSGEQSAGTTTALTLDSHAITRLTGAAYSESYVIEWSVLHPDRDDTYTATFSSSDANIATVDSGGSITVVAAGEVTISVTVTRASDSLAFTRSIPVSVDIYTYDSVDYIRNVAGSAGKAFDDGLNTLIQGKVPSTTKPRFSGRDLAVKSFTRNENFWGIGLSGLSAVSPNNSRGQNKRAGTAITKRHIVCAAHYPLSVGDTIDFVEDASGAVTAVTRTIIQAKTHPLYTGASGNYCYDVQVCLLDSDLPAEIDFMEVLPSDFENYTGGYKWMGTMGCSFDQEQKGISTLHGIITYGNYYGQKLSDHWFTHLSPSSMLNGVNYTPSALGVSSPANFVSPELAAASDEQYTFAEKIVSGDSGAPHCFVVGSKLLLVGLNTAPLLGSYLPSQIADLNQLIIDVDTLSSISTGYTVTEGDLSSYTDYSQ